MFSTDFIFRQQENLVDNQKCWAGFRPLCNKILLNTPSSGSVAYVCHMSQSISFLIYLCKEEKHYAHMSRSTNQSTNVVIVCPPAPDTFHRLCN